MRFSAQGHPRFLIIFSKAQHMSYPERDQYTPHLPTNSVISISILFSCLCLVSQMVTSLDIFKLQFCVYFSSSSHLFMSHPFLYLYTLTVQLREQVVVTKSKIKTVRCVVKLLPAEIMQQCKSASSCIWKCILKVEHCTGCQHSKPIALKGPRQSFKHFSVQNLAELIGGRLL
jgi:hypothetical protein